MSRDDNFQAGCGLFILGVIFIALIVTVLITPSPYSTGFIDGQLQHLSYKGVLRRTHEGTLALSGFRAKGDNGAISNVMAFSVEDQETTVIEALTNVPPGATIRLHYKTYKFYNPFSYSSGNRIHKVEVLR